MYKYPISYEFWNENYTECNKFMYQFINIITKNIILILYFYTFLLLFFFAISIIIAIKNILNFNKN